MEALIFLPIVAIFALVVAVVVYQYKKNQARIRSLMHLALSKGWQYSAHDPYGLVHRWDGAPFDQGYDRRVEHVITGRHGDHAMVAFDYSYKEDSADSKGNRSTTTYRFGVVALAMPCELPGLHVAPEGFFSRVGQLLGMQDIELESEDFNRRFRVKCPDAKFASDVLTPRTMELLLANGKVRFRFAGNDVLWFDGGALEPTELLRGLHVLTGVLEGIPSFVWRDRGVVT